MRIVVSGSTGNTGVAVVETLSKLGHEVVALSRTPSSGVSVRLASLPGVSVVTNEEAFTKPVDRLYVCFPPSPTLFTDETEFLRQAVKANVKYIVKLATSEGFMQDDLDLRFYARAHSAIENILERGKVPFTSLRANIFYSWLGIQWEEVPKTKKFSSVIGPSGLAGIHPADVGRAAGTLLGLADPSAHYGKRYNLAGPVDLTISSITADLSEVLHEKITFDHSTTEDEYVAGMKQFAPAHLAEAVRGGMKELQHEGQQTIAKYPTSPELLSLCPPTVTFKQFLQELYAPKK